jgi:5'-deoxynucleotidase YfbR-like HD superfamily hydrolase
MKFSLENVINLARSGGTLRFHTHYERVLKHQTVGSHTYNVFFIALALTHGDLSRNAMLAAMIHDSGEHWSGDIPAPTKLALTPEARADYERFDQQELRVATGLADDDSLLSDEERLVIKIADAMDGALFCVREAQLGNSLARGMLKNFHSYYKAAISKYINRRQGSGYPTLIDWNLYNDLNTFIESYL